MNYLKAIYKPFLYTVISILIGTFILTILSYINILNYNMTTYIKFIIGIVSFIIGGYFIGNKSIKKGYIKGIKFSLILIIFMVIISTIFNTFKYKSIIYYLVLIISSTIGSMIGINKKNKD